MDSLMKNLKNLKGALVELLEAAEEVSKLTSEIEEDIVDLQERTQEP